MLNLYDSHCHLNAAELASNLDDYIEQARQAGVNHWLIPATSPDQWSEIYNLSQKYPGIQAALGIHPWYVDQIPLSSLDCLPGLIQQHSNTIAAIGETGLDAVRPSLPKQIQYFETHLTLAATLNLPVIIHCVKAQDHVVRCLKKSGVSKGVIHGFTGSIQQAEQLIDLGMKIGIGGAITYERARKTREAVTNIPIEAIVLETDAPSMPLSGFQGQPNEPSKLRLVFNALLSLRTEPQETIATQIWQNTIDLFGEQGV